MNNILGVKADDLEDITQIGWSVGYYTRASIYLDGLWSLTQQCRSFHGATTLSLDEDPTHFVPILPPRDPNGHNGGHHVPAEHNLDSGQTSSKRATPVTNSDHRMLNARHGSNVLRLNEASLICQNRRPATFLSHHPPTLSLIWTGILQQRRTRTNDDADVLGLVAAGKAKGIPVPGLKKAWGQNGAWYPQQPAKSAATQPPEVDKKAERLRKLQAMKEKHAAKEAKEACVTPGSTMEAFF
ncbi:hypothetical protein B0H66DRAFT_636580 [Apodospora peruviana]|uniref:Uncharacterized protein n=1 Tax=Apodospora peruviana TaxID=516989 RepID=A0AAE0IH80_9PEZI|nr:hypothetical protein B0H66DRAFT_636580 [Apodospora peruviana]